MKEWMSQRFLTTIEKHEQLGRDKIFSICSVYNRLVFEIYSKYLCRTGSVTPSKHVTHCYVFFIVATTSVA